MDRKEFRRRRRHRRLPLVFLLVSGALLGNHLACLKRVSTGGDQPERIVWPPPPAAARIEFVRSFRKPTDLGIRKNWFVRFFKRLAVGRQTLEMTRPHGLAVAPTGEILVADPDYRCVHRFDPERSEYHRLTMADGRPLESPIGVAVDHEGRIYVSDSLRRRVFRFNPRGEWLDTIGSEGDLLRPTGIALDPPGKTLLVVDTLGHRVVSFDLAGSRLREIGRRGTGPGEFNYPVAVAVDGHGRLFITDSMNFRVQILDSTGRFLGSFGRAGNGPGDFDKVKGIAVDRSGHIYVVEALHDVIHVFDFEGSLLTIIGGTGMKSGQFWLPTGIHIDHQERIWISDSANHRVQVLRILEKPPDGEPG